MDTTLRLHALPSLWQRLLDRFRRPAAEPPPAPLRLGDLAHLDERTLRDIGAPEWDHACATGVAPWMLERMRW